MKKSFEISVKNAPEEDAYAIAKSLPEFFTQDGLNDLSRDLKIHRLRGAFVNGTLVGFITLREADKNSVEISWLAVKKDFQGMGIGSELVKDSLNELSRKGFSICYVKTLAETVEDEGYKKTRKFYKDLGFNTLEIINPYPGWSANNPCQILAASIPLK